MIGWTPPKSNDFPCAPGKLPGPRVLAEAIFVLTGPDLEPARAFESSYSSRVYRPIPTFPATTFSPPFLTLVEVRGSWIRAPSSNHLISWLPPRPARSLPVTVAACTRGSG